MEPERRFAELRYDAERGLIEGVAMRYGDRARIGPFSEEFRAGALTFNDIIVNLQHDRSKPVARTGAGLELRDSATELRVAITLPDTVHAREARELVAARIMRGFSVEFRAETDRWEGEHRIVERASLLGLAIVDRPAYSDSTIAERMQHSRDLARPQCSTRRYWF
ncbi:MAG: HK97 family phage prohead protease [Deltaproteobacteria bacterium]|nr:HK97 family phage prohead protease [Deltaproteobacteria bacterium]